jgi:hypothetical protein
VKIAKLTSNVLAGVLLICAASAHANNTYNIGILDEAPYSLTNPYVNNASVIGSFLDTYNFSLSNVSNVSGSVNQLTLSLGAFNVLNIDNIGLNLFDSSNNWLIGLSGAGQVTSILNSGNYYATVFGTANGSAGGNYTFSTVAQPIPEPDSWMLMLAGLVAATGFTVLRRRGVF